MQAQVKQVEGLVMVGKADSNHWMVMDTAKTHEGTGAGSSPMEILLIALGGCFGMHVISLLTKKRVLVESFKVKLDSERTDEHPRVFTQINVKCMLSGKKLKEEDVKWAIERVSQKYCSVGIMLKKTAQINYSWEIVSS